MKSIAFFNSKEITGKTMVIYHIAHMLSELGHHVLVADLDPQAKLTSYFLVGEELETLYETPQGTAVGGIKPLMEGVGDIARVEPILIQERLHLMAGHLSLATVEDRLSSAWKRCRNADEGAVRDVSAFYRIIAQAGRDVAADIVLIDIGPNVGSINRSALLAADHLVVPITPDLLSLKGVETLGLSVRRWREQWQDSLRQHSGHDLDLPSGNMRPTGYITLQHSARQHRVAKTNENWIDRIPATYQQFVLGVPSLNEAISIHQDPHCLGLLKRLVGVTEMAREARKPIFFLKYADGAIGSHALAVQLAYQAFEELAHRLLEACQIPVKS